MSAMPSNPDAADDWSTKMSRLKPPRKLIKNNACGLPYQSSPQPTIKDHVMLLAAAIGNRSIQAGRNGAEKVSER